jgi:hypothetical protein
MKKKTARLTLPQEATERTKHRKNQTRGDKKQKIKRKTHTSMNKSASLTPVQGLAKQTAPPCLQQLSVLSNSLLLHIVFLEYIHPAIPSA